MENHMENHMENQPLPKMYIAVRDDVPDHIVPTLVAHAVLAAHLQAQTLCEDFALYQAWLQHSFRKVVLRVNDKEFSKIKLLNVHLAHESTVLAGEKCCAVVYPMAQVPNVLKFGKLWQPKIPV